MAKKKLTDLTGQQVVQYYDPSGPAAGDLFWSMSATRAGCYIADGTDYAQASEPELFASIGSTFNTQINPTTGSAWAAPSAGRFRVPDMRGVVPRGAGTPVNGSALAVGDYQADQMQGHRHGFSSSSSQYTAGVGLRAAGAGGTPEFNIVTDPSTDGVNGTPRVGGETRGKARGGNWFIRRFNPTAVSYNGGLAGPLVPGMVKPRSGWIDVVVTGTGWTTVRAKAKWYQEQDGTHKMQFNIYGLVTATVRTSYSATISGTVFKSGLAAQAVAVSFDAASNVFQGGYVAGSGVLTTAHGSVSTTGYYWSGDVELESKPSWA